MSMDPEKHEATTRASDMREREREREWPGMRDAKENTRTAEDK